MKFIYINPNDQYVRLQIILKIFTCPVTISNLQLKLRINKDRNLEASNQVTSLELQRKTSSFVYSVSQKKVTL